MSNYFPLLSKVEYILLPADPNVDPVDRDELSIFCENCNPENAIISVGRFIKEKFTPLDIGYQTNNCKSVTTSLDSWSNWTECPPCGGKRNRTRPCKTTNNDVLIWSVENSQWEFQNRRRILESGKLLQYISAIEK